MIKKVIRRPVLMEAAYNNATVNPCYKGYDDLVAKFTGMRRFVLVRTLGRDTNTLTYFTLGVENIPVFEN